MKDFISEVFSVSIGLGTWFAKTNLTFDPLLVWEDG